MTSKSQILVSLSPPSLSSFGDIFEQNFSKWTFEEEGNIQTRYEDEGRHPNIYREQSETLSTGSSKHFLGSIVYLLFPVERVSLCSLQIIALKLVRQFCYCYKICPCCQSIIIKGQGSDQVNFDITSYSVMTSCTQSISTSSTSSFRSGCNDWASLVRNIVLNKF